ncbi:hypothetical protein [Aquipuribacter hungaricus]|uniref:hypothetical protein n=1 Tax=Aquipuribacter hungaricus TaxID=545624 RepID=UPI0030ED86F5
MSTPSPPPSQPREPRSAPGTIPTQRPSAPLSRALDLLDGLLCRSDVPGPVRRDLADVFDDLVDVRPPYPPTTPTHRRDQPWPAVAQEIADALRELIDHPDPATVPAVAIRHSLALRALRGAIAHTRSPGVEVPAEQG